jgi:2-polyprenyl-6-methoxyphenol hydroxylase-like FAD-dependent oxidoreductase
MQVIIIGAGVAGLATALSLAEIGLTPVVYEAVETPAPLGVGINLLPHAMRELSELGLQNELGATGVAIDELVYLTKYGRQIWREPRGLAAGYRWPQIAIHRGELQMLLLARVRERLGPDAVRFGHALADLETSGQGAVARFVDRTSGRALGSASGDLLIAADGIHSAARRKFYPDEGRPKWNGVTLWRSTTVIPEPLGGARMIWAGHSRQKFVAYPIRRDPRSGETLLNWICDLKAETGESPQPEDWNRKGDRGVLLERFGDWRWDGVDVPAIVAASGDIYEFPMIDRDPLPRWTFGRATLLGDAAHPMYPIGSNGATQAIIDARVLAFHLATAPDIDAGLARYEADRREATARIVLMNRALGPDKVMDLAEARAPTPAHDLDTLLPTTERAAIAAEYKQVAGFDPAVLNARASYSPP